MTNAYYIHNNRTGESNIVYATSAHEACNKMGWLEGDCYVKEVRRWVSIRHSKRCYSCSMPI